MLYAVGFDGLTHVLLTIDKATGAGTTVGPTNVSTAAGCRTVSDIAFRSDGALYAYAEPCDTLGVIDTSTGAFTLLGFTGQGDFGNGIAFSPGDVLLHAGGDTINGPFAVEPACRHARSDDGRVDAGRQLDVSGHVHRRPHPADQCIGLSSKRGGAVRGDELSR